MNRFDNFSDESLAVEAISADVGLLEKLAARGGTLCEDDLKLLMQCNARLIRLLPELSVNAACSGTRSSASRPPVRIKSEPAARVRYHVSAG